MIAACLAGSLMASLLNLTAVSTSFVVVSDPVDSTLAPKAIPGAVVDYTAVVTNDGLQDLDSGSLTVIIPVPANTQMYVNDLGAAGGGPIVFSQGVPSSGTTYTYSSLSSTTDDVDFSSDGGSTFGYAPTPDANGFDASVTDIRVRPQGGDSIGGIFQVRFRVSIK